MRSKQFYSYFEGILSIILNLIIFALKYWVGIVTGSVAFIADAWHSLSDSLSSIILIMGAKASSIPADKEHPFGHGRAEYIASLIIGVFLSIVGYNFIIAAWEKLQSHEIVIYGNLSLIVIIISILLKEGLAQYAFYAARKTKSPALKADGWHHRSDALSSVIILIGIFIGKYFWWIDSAMAAIVALMIFYAAYKVFSETVSNLLGEEPSPELIKQIKEICDRAAGIEVRAHHIHLHHYGDHNELTLHVKFPLEYSLVEAHGITSLIEKLIKEELDMIATIHMEPRKICF